MEWTMRMRTVVLALLAVVLITSAGCAAVEGIFKAGMGVGIVVTVLILGGVVFLFTRFSGR
jgi:hypothetical protein